MDATATAATVRQALKVAGIAARCRVAPGSRDCVQVFTTQFAGTDGNRLRFTDIDQHTVRSIAIDLGLTWVRGLPIDIDQMTNPFGFDFYLPTRTR